MKPYEFEQLVCDHYRQKAIAYRQLLLRMIMASMYLQRKRREDCRTSQDVRRINAQGQPANNDGTLWCSGLFRLHESRTGNRRRSAYRC